MADFTQIIQEINDDIKTNGVGAITGAKLNEVLRDMISAVNDEKQDTLTIDATPTDDSTNPVQSGGVYDALDTKADKVQLATANNIATLGANGNLKDSGVSIDNVAMDANVVHKTGDETINGEKTFADKTIFGNEVKLIDSNEIGATFYSSEEGKIEFYGSPGEGTVQLKNITSPSASDDAATKGYVDDEVAGKQDVISDLSTIRSGAAAGATAVQPSDLATVATSGSYNDLLNKPTIPAAQVQSDWNEADNTKVDYIKNKPTIPEVSGKADKVSGATSGDFAGLDSDGNLTDSGRKAADFATAAQGTKADTAVQQVTVGTTTTGNAGTNASVTNSGTSTAPVLDFTIPRGADGADAVNPFKGWYDSSSNLPSNPVVGDYAYVKGASASDPAAIYECTTAGTWSDSGRTLGDSNDINNIYSILYGNGLAIIGLDQYSATRLASPVYTTADDAIRIARYWLSNDVDYSCFVGGNNIKSNTTFSDGLVLAPWGSSRDVVANAIMSNPRTYFYLLFRKGDGTQNISTSELSLVSLQTGGVVDDVADVKSILKKDDYAQYQDCSVSVDTNVANVVDDNLSLQDAQVFESDSGRIYLPTSYSPMGKKTRLIIHCHGASQNYNNGSVFPTASSLVTIDYLLAKGYAVLDVNGMPGTHSFYATTIGNPVAYRSYVAAYKWAVQNFNLYNEIFVIGISAGSVPALQISNIGNIPVLACVTYCGIMDFTRGWMLLGGYHAGSQGPSIKAYLATKFGFTGTQPTLGDVDPCSDEEWKYLVDNVDKFLGWNPYTMGITSTMTREEYRAILSTIYGDNPPSWIDSDYEFESVQQMLMAFKIPQRGDLTAYQTAIAQEQKLFDTCSIHRRVPTKIFHATNDDVAPYRYSKYFYEMCKRGGSTVEMRTFSSGGHNPTGNTVTETVNGQNITTNVLSVEALDWLQRFETE